MLRDADDVMLNGKYHSNKNISVKNRRKIQVFKKAIWSQLDSYLDKPVHENVSRFVLYKSVKINKIVKDTE